MSINNQLRDSVSPAELAIHAKTVEASRKPFSVLAINGGSSSIRFALQEDNREEPSRKRRRFTGALTDGRRQRTWKRVMQDSVVGSAICRPTNSRPAPASCLHFYGVRNGKERIFKWGLPRHINPKKVKSVISLSDCW